MSERRDETEWERADRNLGELLQELRVALPGVQVLFAFLLAVPFQKRFAEVSDFQQTVYYVTLIFTAIASWLLIAPTAYHRLTFHHQQKKRLLRLANRATIAGVACLALAITGAMTLITGFLYGRTATLVVCAVSLAAFSSLWIAVPLAARKRERADPGSGPA